MAETPQELTPSDAEAAASQLEEVFFEVKKVIVGQDHMVERLLVAVLARGHILLEGLPGLAKTLAVSTLADSIGGTYTRLQFTPDLLPSDLVGTRVFHASKESFDIEWGPVFANFVLTDEINRAPAKVQSALLEVMAERQVSIGGVTREMPKPFLVLATQNPIESEGVYTLPEAQRDRFLMKVVVGYPSPAEEMEIVRRVGVSHPEASQVITLEKLSQLQSLSDQVYVDTAVVQYAVNIVMATREPEHNGMPELAELIEFGASPRATLGLVSGARALALMRGRSYATAQDIFDIARDVLRHRLILTYEALAKELNADDILNRLLSIVVAPNVAPRQAASPTSVNGSSNNRAAESVIPQVQQSPAAYPAPAPAPLPPVPAPVPPSGAAAGFAPDPTSRVDMPAPGNPWQEDA